MFLHLPSCVIGVLVFVASTFGQGLNVGLKVQHISVALTTQSITQNQASLNFDVANTLSTPTTIKQMTATLGALGLVPILSFDHAFSNFVVPAAGTANSGTIPNATLTAGVLSIVQILLLPALDIIQADVTLSMQQSGIATNFTLNLI